jgi:hypothetical protein
VSNKHIGGIQRRNVATAICPNVIELLEPVVSCSTGHQVNEGARRDSSYETVRIAKLKQQNEEAAKLVNGATHLLRGTRIYCDGYLEGATDTEVKTIVCAYGGTPLFVSSHGLQRSSVMLIVL